MTNLIIADERKALRGLMDSLDTENDPIKLQKLLIRISCVNMLLLRQIMKEYREEKQ